MLFSKAELQPTPIVENQKIQKTLPFKFESKLLPFQLGKCKNFTDLIFRIADFLICDNTLVCITGKVQRSS